MQISKKEESQSDEPDATSDADQSNEPHSNETDSPAAGQTTSANNSQSGRRLNSPASMHHSDHVSTAQQQQQQPSLPNLPAKPTTSTIVALASIHSLHPQLDLKLNNRFMLMPSNDQVRELQTVIRDKVTTRGNFKFYADRLIRLVVEEGLNQLPIERFEVVTPTGHSYSGIRYLKGNCGVSIVRSGESMEQGLRDCCRSIRIGKILIEQDENNQARVCYTKFPRDIENRRVLVLYPIMSTGLAVVESIKVLLRHGVKEDNLILLNLFSSPRACKLINSLFPRIFVLTSDINPICPNHFGQRYFGTD